MRLTLFRFQMRVTLSLLVIFIATLLVFHVQPYDRDIKDILLPDDCPLPCFMGIRPGITRQTQAIDILKASLWVSEINLQKLPYIVEWKAAPAAERWPNLDTLNVVSFSGDLVENVDLNMNLNVSDVLMVLGRPDIKNIMMDINHFYYTGVYIKDGVIVREQHLCPAAETAIWKSKFTIYYGKIRSLDFGFNDTTPRREIFSNCRKQHS
jgi:hypothetical protein